MGEAYRLKEDFYRIYEAGTPEEAMRRYEAWFSEISTEIRPYFAYLIRAFTKWRPFILNYFEHPATNAYTEGLNSLIEVIWKRKVRSFASLSIRGYSFEAIQAAILFDDKLHDLVTGRNFGVRLVALSKKFARLKESTCYRPPKLYGFDLQF